MSNKNAGNEFVYVFFFFVDWFSVISRITMVVIGMVIISNVKIVSIMTIMLSYFFRCSGSVVATFTAIVIMIIITWWFKCLFVSM